MGRSEAPGQLHWEKMCIRDRPLYQSITALGQMMHYSMDTAHNLVPLNDALHYIELYLKLQKLRFPNSLETEFDLSLIHI